MRVVRSREVQYCSESPTVNIAQYPVILPCVYVYVVRSGEVQYCSESPTVNIAQYPVILPSVYACVVRSGEVQYCSVSPNVNIAQYPVILPTVYVYVVRSGEVQYCSESSTVQSTRRGTHLSSAGTHQVSITHSLLISQPMTCLLSASHTVATHLQCRIKT